MKLSIITYIVQCFEKFVSIKCAYYVIMTLKKNLTKDPIELVAIFETIFLFWSILTLYSKYFD